MSTKRHTSTEVLVIGACLFLVPLVYPPWGGSFLPLKRIVLYATLVGCGGLWLYRRVPIALPRTPALAAGAGYVGLAVLSTLWAANPFTSLVESVHLLTLFALCSVATALVPQDFERLAGYIAGAGLVVALLGLLQYFGVPVPIPSAGQPSATLSFRNIAASFLIGAIPFACLASATDKKATRRKVWWIASGLMVVLLAYTRTRGAWLGMMVGAAVSGAFLIRAGVRPQLTSRQWATLAGGFGIFVYVATLPPVVHRSAPQKFDVVKSSAGEALTSMVDTGSDRGRLVFWRKTGEMILDHPFLGVGLDNWEFHYPRYDRGEWNVGHSEPVRPHNDVLWNWSELGLLGAACYLGMIFLPIVGAFRAPSEGYPILTAALLASIAALFTHSLFSFLREQPAPSVLFWLSVAGLIVVSRPSRTINVPAWAAIPTVLLGLSGIGLSTMQARFDVNYRVASQLYDNGDLGGGAHAVRKAIENGPFDHRALFLEGRILQTSNRPNEAIQAYHRALTYHPNYANTHHNLGGVYAAAGNTPAAIHHIREALDIRPTYDQARINLANILIRSGDLTSAASELEVVVVRGSGLRAEAHSLLGAIALHRGETPTAIDHLEKAIAIKPEFADAYNNLAVAYESAGRIADAADAYRKVVRHWKGDPSYLEAVRGRIDELERDSL